MHLKVWIRLCQTNLAAQISITTLKTMCVCVCKEPQLLQEKAKAVVQYFLKNDFSFPEQSEHTAIFDRWLQDGDVASRRASLYIIHMTNTDHERRQPTVQDLKRVQVIREKLLQYVSWGARHNTAETVPQAREEQGCTHF